MRASLMPLCRDMCGCSSLRQCFTLTRDMWPVWRQKQQRPQLLLRHGISVPVDIHHLELSQTLLHIAACLMTEIHGVMRAKQVSDQQAEPSIFGRLAVDWFPAMVEVLVRNVSSPEKIGIHLVMLDTCVSFLSWPLLFPVPPRGGAAARLMDYLVRGPPVGTLHLARILLRGPLPFVTKPPSDAFYISGPQVRAAYNEDSTVQRNNFNLIKVFISKWQVVPPPLEAMLVHVSAGGPHPAQGSRGRVPKQVAEQRAYGLRLFAAGHCRPPSLLSCAPKIPVCSDCICCQVAC
jgi:hypothetical protein